MITALYVLAEIHLVKIPGLWLVFRTNNVNVKENCIDIEQTTSFLVRVLWITLKLLIPYCKVTFSFFSSALLSAISRKGLTTPIFHPTFIRH
jgi:hypothetical protein